MSAEQQNSERDGSRTSRCKTEVGLVTSNKMNKTLVVEVSRVAKHPKYGKYVKRNKTYQVHDENNEGAIGDQVQIAQTRPLSKNKRWRLVKILKRREA